MRHAAARSMARAAEQAGAEIEQGHDRPAVKRLSGSDDGRTRHLRPPFVFREPTGRVFSVIRFRDTG